MPASRLTARFQRQTAAASDAAAAAVAAATAPSAVGVDVHPIGTRQQATSAIESSGFAWIDFRIAARYLQDSFRQIQAGWREMSRDSENISRAFTSARECNTRSYTAGREAIWKSVNILFCFVRRTVDGREALIEQSGGQGFLCENERSRACRSENDNNCHLRAWLESDWATFGL